MFYRWSIALFQTGQPEPIQAKGKTDRIAKKQTRKKTEKIELDRDLK